MGISVFGYIVFAVLVGAPASALWALRVSLKRGRFQIADIGTLLFPPIVFFLAGRLRPEIHIGWAMFLWPIIIAVVSMYAFALKVFALDSRVSKSALPSVGLFVVCLVVAVLLAFTVPPWYD
jgi:hypothetical protein